MGSNWQLHLFRNRSWFTFHLDLFVLSFVNFNRLFLRCLLNQALFIHFYKLFNRYIKVINLQPTFHFRLPLFNVIFVSSLHFLFNCFSMLRFWLDIFHVIGFLCVIQPHREFILLLGFFSFFSNTLNIIFYF